MHEPTGSAAPSARSLPAEAPLCRSVAEFKVRDSQDGGPVVMTGHFSVFNTWTTIRSAAEGTFRERIAPGAFKKTLRERGDQVRVLFQHGKDPSTGQKPLGTIVELREDEQGAYYEVELFDTDYVRELLPALRSGQLGASFQFVPTREKFNAKPQRSAENPEGLPEVTVTELKLIEFGPVTFGAYPTATAGVRSLTDDYLANALGGPEELRALADRIESRTADEPELHDVTIHLSADPQAIADELERLDRSQAEVGERIVQTLAALAEAGERNAEIAARAAAAVEALRSSAGLSLTDTNVALTALAKLGVKNLPAAPAEPTPTAPSDSAAAPGHRTPERRETSEPPKRQSPRRFA